jgi:hypothetical protein
MLKQEKHLKTRNGGIVVCCFLVLAMIFWTMPVRADGTGIPYCEPNDAAPDARDEAQDDISFYGGYIGQMMGTIWALEQGELTALKALSMDYLETMEEDILERMNKVWPAWLEAWVGMSNQLSASVIDQTRQVASLHDSSSITSVARQVQDKEIEAIRTYKPTEEGCTFDSTGPHRARASGTGRAVSRGMTSSVNKLGGNKQGTPAAKGAAAWQKSRYENYRTNFCDQYANGGTGANCADGPMKNAHIYPSKTIFGRETLNTDNSDASVVTATENAVNELTLNLTGFEVGDPIDPDVLRQPAGSEQRQLNREYLAQMDVTTSLISSIVGERTPGAAAPHIKAKRLASGVQPNEISDHPSEREIRQADIEQLWSPRYYAHLDGSPTGTTQKELYLRALNVMMLYKLIEKTERISTSFSVQTGNLLKKTDDSRDSGMQYGRKK